MGAATNSLPSARLRLSDEAAESANDRNEETILFLRVRADETGEPKRDEPANEEAETPATPAMTALGEIFKGLSAQFIAQRAL